MANRDALPAMAVNVRALVPSCTAIRGPCSPTTEARSRAQGMVSIMVGDQSSAITGLRRMPTPVTSTSTTSPGFIHKGGVW